jgi:hypothetical protein
LTKIAQNAINDPVQYKPKDADGTEHYGLVFLMGFRHLFWTVGELFLPPKIMKKM